MNAVKVIRAYGIKVWFVGDLFGKFKVMIAKCTDTGKFIKHADAVARITRLVICGHITTARDDMRRHVNTLYSKIVALASHANKTGIANDAKIVNMLKSHSEMVASMF